MNEYLAALDYALAYMTAEPRPSTSLVRAIEGLIEIRDKLTLAGSFAELLKELEKTEP